MSLVLCVMIIIISLYFGISGWWHHILLFFFRSAVILLFFQKPFSSGKVISKRQVCLKFCTVQLFFNCSKISMFVSVVHILSSFIMMPFWLKHHHIKRNECEAQVCDTFFPGLGSASGDQHLTQHLGVLYISIVNHNFLPQDEQIYLFHKWHWYQWPCKAMVSTCHNG